MSLRPPQDLDAMVKNAPAMPSVRWTGPFPAMVVEGPTIDAQEFCCFVDGHERRLFVVAHASSPCARIEGWRIFEPMTGSSARGAADCYLWESSSR